MTEMNESSMLISISTGITVPTLQTYQSTRLGTHPVVIFGHGLGSTNPKLKDHLKDKWIALATDAVSDYATVISYTARGHGRSTGWELSAETNPTQFTWIELGKDMTAVADHFSTGSYIAGGSSMGSATSLYAAIEHPERVLGLILIRPPTAWEARTARRKNLLNSADRLQKQELDAHQSAVNSGSLSTEDTTPRFHHVLRGTAYSDLPPVDSAAYKLIQHIPTLILTIEGDAAHPVATAEALHTVLPRSSLHVAPDIDTAAATWPTLIKNFVRAIPQTNM